jgi:hypothetical protein
MFPTQTATDRMTRARQLTGEANIIPVRTQLAILRERGILIDVNITGTNLFKKALSWLESGIREADSDDIRKEYFTKGSKYVWNDKQAKELMSVVTQMRQLLAESTYQVTGFHPYRYMAFTMHAHFVRRWSDLSVRFYNIKAAMIADREAVVDELATKYAEIAEDIFKALTAKNKAKYVQVAMRNGSYRTMDLVEWVSFMVENTVKAIPTAEQLEERLHADYVTGLLYTDMDDATELNSAHQDMLASTNGDPRITEMLRYEATRRQNAPKSSPFMEVFSALREEISEAAREVLDSIGRNKFIHGKVAQRARGLLDLFDRKAAHTDEELRRLLVMLRNEAKPASDEDVRDVENVKIILRSIIDLKPSDIKSNAFTAVELD